MNNSLKNLIIFASGAAVGAVTTWLCVKGYYELKADLEVDSVKDAYAKKLDEIDAGKSSLEGELEGPSKIDEPEEGVKPSVKSIVDKINNKPPLKDYSKFFKEKSESELAVKEIVRDEKVDPAEAEGPKDDEPYTDEEDKEQQIEYEGYQLNGEHQKALAENRAPYLIELSDYEMTCANYEKLTLLYYICDDILVDEDGDEVRRGDLIGSTIIDSGFGGNDEEIMYVRNDKLMCDYEVTKVYTPYEK